LATLARVSILDKPEAKISSLAISLGATTIIDHSPGKPFLPLKKKVVAEKAIAIAKGIAAD